MATGQLFAQRDNKNDGVGVGWGSCNRLASPPGGIGILLFTSHAQESTIKLWLSLAADPSADLSVSFCIYSTIDDCEHFSKGLNASIV